MRLEDSLNKILIIDFGSQFTQLIARKIRELGAYCEIISHNKITNRKNLENNIKGLILSGGPHNVYQNKKVKFNKKLLHSNIPVLGICFGHQIISKEMGGKVKQSKSREFGLAKVKKLKNSILTKNFFSRGENKVWMSHADEVTKLPNIDQLNRHARLKLDDKDFKFSNNGVWVHPIRQLKTQATLTTWEEYKDDKEV